MNAEDVKLPRKYLVGDKKMEEYLDQEYSNSIKNEVWYNKVLYLYSNRPAVVEITEEEHGYCWCPSLKMYFPSNWLVSTEVDTKEAFSDSCHCPNPVVVKAFSGIAAAGQYYDFCRCCKKERK